MSHESAADSTAPFWEFVPIGDFSLPADTQLNVARKKWRSLRSFFQTSQEPLETHAKAEEDLRALPTLQLENLAPPVHWGAASAALDRFLTARSADGLESEIFFLIGQPYVDQAAILRHWAISRKVAVLEGPDPAAILSRQSLEKKSRKPIDSGWVIPELERWFLRHADGLWLVRELLEQVASGEMGGGIIGCNSWAWAYLQRVWPIPNPTALVLQAFDGRALARYFMVSSLAGGEKQVRFLNARTGEPLLSRSGEKTGTEEEVSRDLQQLAAHCRGNVEIARQYWRKRLRTAPESEQARTFDAEAVSSGASAGEDVVWLAPGIEAPVLPVETGDDLIFILHNLLLHNGLSATTLAELMPVPKTQLVSNLLRLQSMEMVESSGGFWRVSAQGYPGVREFLRSHGYLVDAF